MEVLIALGHFCDAHGPCVVFCTQKTETIPENLPIVGPICEACHSIDSNTVYNCQDETSHWISTRNTYDPQLGLLLKDAVLRSLSIEVMQEEGKDDGTMYFGDNQRGHVISHVFDIKDSLARGFKRKYCIVVLGKHQMPLLNHFNHITKTLMQISRELQSKANKVNEVEQFEKSQRHVRQCSGGNYKLNLRPLPSLVGESEIFQKLHLWFVYLLRSEIYRIVPCEVPEYPVKKPDVKQIRDIYKTTSSETFRTILYSILVGIKIDNESISNIFKQLLPVNFKLPISGKICYVTNENGVYTTKFDGTIPQHLPTLQNDIETSLADENLPDPALAYYLMSLTLKWFNIACILNWTPNNRDNLTNSLGVRNCDMPLLSYWISQSYTCNNLSFTTKWFE